MDFTLASRLCYYSKDDSVNLIEKIGRELSIDVTGCRHKLLCLFDDIVATATCRYWNRSVCLQAAPRVEQLAASCEALKINKSIMEYLLIG